MAGLLKGVKVFESAVLLTGDYLGMLLGDQGADVIKVEAPGIGDYIRDFMGQVAPHYSPYHLFVNRNKKSVTLDMRKEEGQALFHRLVKSADVFVTGNVGDTPRKLGMDYETLQKWKPDLVYCQATGYGAEGPYGNMPTHGRMMDALAAAIPVGMGEDGRVRKLEVTPGARGTAGGGDGVAVGPMYAAYGVAAALFRRDRTGQGAYIDVSCTDSVIASSWSGALFGLNEGRFTREGMPPDKGMGESAKYQYYQTKDEKFILFCGIEPKFWNNFCRAIDRPDWTERHSLERPVDFGDDQALRDELQRVFHTKTRAEWTELFRAHDIAAGPVTTIDELDREPHLAVREIVLETEHPVAGSFRTIGDPIRVRDEPFEVRVPAPALGEHTREVLSSLGLSAQDFDGLQDRGVI